MMLMYQTFLAQPLQTYTKVFFWDKFSKVNSSESLVFFLPSIAWAAMRLPNKKIIEESQAK